MYQANRKWQIYSIESFESFRNSWDAIVRSAHSGNVLLDSRFLELLLKYFGTGNEGLAILEKNSTPVAALVIENARSLFSIRTFVPSQLALVPVVTMSGSTFFLDLVELLRERSAHSLLIDVMRLDKPVLGITRQSEYQLPVVPAQWGRTISIALEGQFEDYWQCRPKSLRKAIRHTMNHVKADGLEIHTRTVVRSSDIRSAVKSYGTIESKGWKYGVGTAIGDGNIQEQFYSDLLYAYSLTRQSLISELYLDGVLVASRLAIMDDRQIVILKTTFDESYRSYAAGKLHLHLLIEELFSSYPGRSLEFYTKANVDQMRWATSSRDIEHVRLFRSPMIAAVWPILRAVRRGRP